MMRTDPITTAAESCGTAVAKDSMLAGIPCASADAGDGPDCEERV